MSVTIDIASLPTEPEIELAPDSLGDRYTVMLPGVEMVISHEQLESIWKQVRPWFEDAE